MKIYRILDAEINRISEGFRCLEDVFRFCYENDTLSKKLKEFRHRVRKLLPKHMQRLMMKERAAAADPGFKISQECIIDVKSNTSELVYANFKRIQEGLRSVEEITKTIAGNRISKKFELIRFHVYDLEKYAVAVMQKTKLHNPLNTDLYCLSGEKFSKGRDNIQVVSEMIKADVKIIQYREKTKSLLEKYEQCKIIREMTLKENVTFIVNDDIALAQIVDADGVHIGQDDLPPEEVRKIIGSDKIIGFSTHSPEQGLAAVKSGVDYIGVGPIYPTQTKENVCAAVGLEYLDWVIDNLDIPFVAIGGIKKHNVKDVVKHGAICVAMVTEILEADSIKDEINEIRNIKNEYNCV